MNDYTPPPPPPPSGGGPPAAGGADVGSALSYGWAKLMQHLGPSIAIVLIPALAQLVIVFIGQFVIRSFAGILVAQAISMVVSLVLGIGYFNLGLMITRGETPDIGKAFSSDRWGEWIGFSFVYGLMVGVGAIFCGIGALVVIAFWGLAPFYFIDKRMSLGDALSASLETTRAVNGLPLALALTALVGYLGIVACFVGILFTMPMAFIGAAFLYRRATNQPVAP